MGWTSTFVAGLGWTMVMLLGLVETDRWLSAWICGILKIYILIVRWLALIVACVPLFLPQAQIAILLAQIQPKFLLVQIQPTFWLV